MKNLLSHAKKVLLLLLAFSVMTTSTLASITTSAAEGYSVTATEKGIVCSLDGEEQHNTYLYISYVDDIYSVAEVYDETTLLYYFNSDGTGTVYTGIYDGKHYESGAIAKSDVPYFLVSGNKLYRISIDGSASVYIKDSSKSGTHIQIVDGVCYNVSYKTGEVTKFTGVYNGKYYKSGKLGTASNAYYKVYGNKLYKVSANGNAAIYKKDVAKNGTYNQIVDGVCYSISYKTGDVTKFTGVYGGKYYKSGKLGTASGNYYKVYDNKLYRVNANGSAAVFKRDTKKNGTYVKAVDGIYYNVSYKTGAVTKFTGTYGGKFYKSGKPTNGWQTVNKKKYYCKSGVAVKGINKINGKIYYFDNKGVLYTGTGWKTINKKKYYFTKGVAKTGWTIINRVMYNFNANGVLSVNKTIDGVKVNANGKATGPRNKYVPLYAKVLAKSITKTSNTKEQNLKICFDYVIKTYKSNGNPRIPHYTKSDWIYVYAYDMYGDRGGGNCFSYAAAFAFLAKECGYTEVYGCNSGGHGWVEIDGKVYDPEQYKDVGKKIYGLDYSNPMISNYKGAISSYKKNPWMRVRIPG